MKTFLLPESTAQKIINYLVKRPYDEVYLLVSDLMQLKTIEPNSPIAYEKNKKEHMEE